jgi:tetratricopeptide (TPR) repeat protein
MADDPFPISQPEPRAPTDEWYKIHIADEERHRMLLQEAERELGVNHPALTYSLAYLGDACSREMGREAEAEQFYKRAIAIWEQHDPDNWLIAQPLNNLGILYATQERFAEAEPLMERALQIEDKHGAKDERLYAPLSSLTYIYLIQGKEDQADAMYLRREEIAEKLGADATYYWYPVQMTHISFDENPYQVAEKVYYQALEEKNSQSSENYQTGTWQEIKQRMQGAFNVFTGKSAAVDFQRLSQLELSHSIVQDDLAYSKERDIEEGIEPER